MRTLVIILLLANLGFAAWATLIDRPAEPAAAHDISRLPRLMLAGEAAAGGGAGSGSAPALSAPVPAPAGAPGAGLPGAPGEAAAAPGAGSDTSASGTTSNGAGPGTAPAGGAMPGAVAAGRPGGAGVVAAAGTASPASFPHCVTVGPFVTAGTAAAAQLLAQDRGLAVRQRTGDGAQYWLDLDLKVASDAVPMEGLLQLQPAGAQLSMKDCPAAAAALPASGRTRRSGHTGGRPG